ncbi:MAG: M1 family metallopeptidase, partial [Bacteroides sp.]
VSVMALALGTPVEAQVVDVWCEEGVSWSLAEHRRTQLTELSSELAFYLPEMVEEPVMAEEVVRFCLKEAEDVVLDFREERGRIGSVRANGRPCDGVRFVNDHLVVPASALRKGSNEVQISFQAGTQSLNRRSDLVYTLFVPDRARTAFPCFDQPNLKASFSLRLHLPEAWSAVSNSRQLQPSSADQQARPGYKWLQFAPTEPLPTYLFAFAAGRMEYRYFPEYGVGAFHRESDPQRIAQLPEIARQVSFALHWLEEFTAMPYPFSKYDIVILPGFQFGGMEHTGATFYNDNTLFLPPNPTPDEELRRTELIAHETAHMWFGDAVTMNWFDDVWTKEVFANYFAAEITQPLFPGINHTLNWLKTYIAAAASQDRTEGRTSIRQPLDNLRNAGLIYNPIIYNKAPVMMRRMVQLMGKEAFRRGIQRYVSRFRYGNATWDQLIEILDSETPEDLQQFSRQWVDSAYWPRRQAAHFRDGSDGNFYGSMQLSAQQIDSLLAYWPTERDATARQALLMNLHENYLECRLGDDRWLEFLIDRITEEHEQLTASTLVSYLHEPLLLRLVCSADSDAAEASAVAGAAAEDAEGRLMALADTHPLPSVRTQLLRLLAGVASSSRCVEQLYQLWDTATDQRLSERDYMTLAYELAVRLPQQADAIVEKQRSRLTNSDRRRQFDFIARAVAPSATQRDALFASLAEPDNRRIEPWTLSQLYYLNHPVRSQRAVHYIEPALGMLPELQRTGDIFFPANWCSNLLAGHRSPEAAQAVSHFLDTHPDLHPLLRNKILTAAYRLQRAAQ